MAIYTNIDQIPHGKYQLIMADPPWTFVTRSKKGVTKKGAGGQYDIMSLDDIKAMPVADIADKNCLLWLWITNPMLPQGLDVLRDWGFEFKTAGHWSKKTKHNKQAFGTGYILRCAGEPFLIGTRGTVKTTRSTRSVIEGPIREHSRKPDEAFDAAEKLIPTATRIELFSRQPRVGWDSLGNEVEKFNGVTVQDGE